MTDKRGLLFSLFGFLSVALLLVLIIEVVTAVNIMVLITTNGGE